jgi:ATP-binding protein involved in chromosome partitioning
VAIRSGLVARQTGQRVIGVIENMSAYSLPDGTVIDLFGAGGGAAVAEALSEPDAPVPLLASIPLSPALRQGGDVGVPVVTSAPDDAAAQAIRTMAAGLARRGRGLAGRSLPMSIA